MKAKKGATATKKRYGGFTGEEKSAMQSRVREMKAGSQATEADVMAKIEELRPPDRAMAKRIHKIVMAAAPGLSPRLWYGMPAYYSDGALLCHFQPAQKFNTRYATLGFSDKAKVDDGNLWPVAYALGQLTAADEARIGALVRKAAG